MNQRHAYLAYVPSPEIDGDGYGGEGLTALAFTVEAPTTGEAMGKVKAFVEEVAELIDAHPGIELAEGMTAITALAGVRQLRLRSHREEIAERARRN